MRTRTSRQNGGFSDVGLTYILTLAYHFLRFFDSSLRCKRCRYIPGVDRVCTDSLQSNWLVDSNAVVSRQDRHMGVKTAENGTTSLWLTRELYTCLASVPVRDRSASAESSYHTIGIGFSMRTDFSSEVDDFEGAIAI